MTMGTHSAQIPTVVGRYMDLIGAWAGYERRHYPVITQVFHPDRGWKRYGIRKRISASWAHKLRAQGVTQVALDVRGHRADFTIKELTRKDRR